MTHTVALPVALSAPLLSLAACAAAQVAYDKSGNTQAERQQGVGG
jgi:hypothetical protein